MTQHNRNKKRIAVNTAFLYGRSVLAMLCGFFATRALLDSIGTIDFGLTNVIASIAGLFSFLTGSLNTATARYLSYEHGKGEAGGLASTFATIKFIYYLLLVILILLVGATGLWLLQNKLEIPESRETASYWLFLGVIVSMGFGILTVPYSSLAVSYENFRFVALVSLGESFFRLLLIYSLYLVTADRLVFYGGIIALLAISQYLFYKLFSRKFEELHVARPIDTNRIKEIFAFSSWNLFGALAAIGSGALTNIFLNIFFGPIVNASRGVANQVSVASNVFTTNFFQASTPQIIKYYAAGEISEMRDLVCMASRYGFLLLFIAAAPLIWKVDFLLDLWLKDVPKHAALFTQLMLIVTIVDSLSRPLMTAVQATGKVATYQVVVGSYLLISVPASYVLLRMGQPPEVVFYVAIGISATSVWLRLFFVKNLVGLEVLYFIKSVIMPALLVSVIPIIALRLYPERQTGELLLNFFDLGVGVSVVLVSVIIFGISSDERCQVKKYVIGRLKK